MNILKDSSFYQLMLKEGRIAEAKRLVIRQGRTRFGRLPRVIRAAIEAIDDLDRLEHLAERILTATSRDDLLAGTK